MFTRIRTIVGSERRFWTFVILVAASAVIQAGAVLSLFPLLRELFSDSPSHAGPWVLLFIALIAVAWAIDIVSAHLGLELGLTVMHRIQRGAPDALLRWPDSRFTATMSADLRRLLSQGAIEATSGIVLMFSPLVTAIVFTLALGVGLLFIFVPAALVTLIGGFLVLAALWASSRLEARADRQFEEATGEMDSRLFEFAVAQPSLRTARQVGIGARMVDRSITSSRRRMLKLLLWQIPGEFLFSLVLQAVLVVFGAVVWFGYDNDTLTGVAAATMVIVLLRVIEQITVISGISVGVNNLSRSLALAETIIGTPDSVSDDQHATRSILEASHPPEVELKKVDITFPDGTAGLRSINLSAQPGSVTVVIGASGAGKSTLLRTLAGLTTPDSGVVELDGNPVSSTDLRTMATVAFQHTVLNSGTLRENLLTVNPDLDDADLDRIATDSRLTPLLAEAPQGWDTPAGELGTRLSGGERQRVGIARALAKPARVLLIDEATSALDASSERAVVEAVDRVRGSYTTVIITHRPAMLDIADQVVVMGEGRILEAGTPTELQAAQGEYARLRRAWDSAAQWQVR